MQSPTSLFLYDTLKTRLHIQEVVNYAGGLLFQSTCTFYRFLLIWIRLVEICSLTPYATYVIRL